MTYKVDLSLGMNLHKQISRIYKYFSYIQGSGKLNFFRSQTKIQKLGPIGNSQKPHKIGPILAQY